MPKQSLTRRNGLPQACEACRKAKARCDHETPTCHRCARRGATCIYDPAPMTRQSLTGSAVRGTSPRIPEPEQVHQVPGNSSRASSSVQTPHSEVVAPSPRVVLFRRPVTAYGTTKFSAVFSENQEKFCFNSWLSPPEGQGIESDRDPMHHNPSLSNNQNNKIQMGVDILRRFPTLRTQQILMDYLLIKSDPWLSAKMTRHCLASTWSQLQQAQTTGTLDKLSAEICANGETSIPLEREEEWFNWFSGSKLRWEMIGILFTVFGMSFYARQEWDPIFSLPEHTGTNRNTAATCMRECADDCLQLCKETDSNEMIVILMKNLGRLDSVLVGDDNDKLLTRSGALMSNFMTVGLHRLPTPTKVTPLSEWRNMIAASAYNLDKIESIFQARPPYLSRFYCTYQIPLDLSDEDMFSGPDVFEAAIKSLDANGWNTKKKINTNTWGRARCYLTPIWEDILEMTLGVNAKFLSFDIDKIIERVDAVEASLPHHIRYSNISEWWEMTGSAREIFLTTRIHLDVLQCHFLLQRLKVSRGFASEQKLFEVSQQMMAAVLSFWLNRDRLVHYVSAFDWFIICYGVPSAGVLCVELLKSASKRAPGPQPVQFSKSEVVQSLTMFLGFLNWTRPTDGNYHLCRKLLQVIKGILDCVLDDPTPPPPDLSLQANLEPNGVTNDENEALLPGSMQIPFIEAHDLNWLNTIDWTQGDWLDCNQPAFFL